jgi:pimeloyl-ACP methyl ester carboxylesterase
MESRLIVVVLLVVLAACHTPRVAPSLPYHLLTVDPRGELKAATTDDAPRVTSLEKCRLDLTPSPQQAVPVHFEVFSPNATPLNNCADQVRRERQYFDGMIGCARKLAREMAERSPDGSSHRAASTIKLLIFVHGGLNAFEKSLSRADELRPKILASGYVPVFVDWDSGFVDSYLEHLFFVRQGTLRGWGWTPLAPFYLFADLVRGLARAPMSIAQLWANDAEASSLCPANEWCIENQKLADDLRHRFCLPAASGGESLSLLTALPAQPTRTVLAPLIDGLGSPAWDNMLRRTSALSRADRDYYPHEVPCPPGTATGALNGFLDALRNAVGEDASRGIRWDITLVGHSMGTIVLNQMIREFGHDLPISNIVYMAAASSVRDYENSVLPYLHDRIVSGGAAQPVHSSKPCDDHPPAPGVPRFYNLMLHPKVEAREGFWLLPKGSLLIWLDGFLMNPVSPLDLTLGRFANVTRTALRWPADLDGVVNLTVCRDGDGAPARHGEFSRIPFWDPRCWEPRNACDPAICPVTQ